MAHTGRLTPIAFGLAILSVIGVTFFDYLVGKDRLTSIFDILPVAYVAYYDNRPQAIALAIFSAVLWSSMEYVAFLHDSHWRGTLWQQKKCRHDVNGCLSGY